MNEVDENTAREPRNANNIAAYPIVSTIINTNLVQNLIFSKFYIFETQPNIYCLLRSLSNKAEILNK